MGNTHAQWCKSETTVHNTLLGDYSSAAPQNNLAIYKWRLWSMYRCTVLVYRIAGIFFAGLNFRGGRFGCLTVNICRLNFHATIVPQNKLALLPKLKTDW